MNAPRSFIRATMAPASLAAAIGMAFAMSAPAQAQYRYPGTAGSSGHYASSIHPIRAGARERAGYGALPGRPEPSTSREPALTDGSQSGKAGGAAYRNPTRFDGAHVRAAQVARPVPAHRPQRAMATMNGGYGNPSMQRGEACPPGSNCAAPTSGRQESNGGGPAPSAGYGGQERYGHIGRAADSVQPAQASGSASISPVRAGAAHQALSYGTSQNAAGYRNAVTGNSSGPSTHVSGQANSFTGPNGKVSMGNSQVTGPNGEKVGQQSPGGKYGGGYGQQKNSGVGYGNSFTDGSGSMRQTGNAPGMANANGMNMNNGGAAGASEQAGVSDSFGEWVHREAADSDPNVVSTTSSDNGTLTWHGDQKWSGTDKGGMTWNNGKPWNGSDGKGGFYTNGHHVKGSGGEMPADTGGTSGPGEVVNGTGQVVHPGKPGGQDTGGGQGKDAGGSGSGDSKNATGQYATSNTPLSGQDAPIKP